MPRTGYRSSSALSIELDEAQPTYFPGDTLEGYVTCDNISPGRQSPSSAVRLKLFGRAKTKYTVETTHGKAIERGRAVLFEEQRTLSKDPICKDGQHAWPFSITIPRTSSPGFATRGDEFKPDGGYLSTTDDSSPRQAIDVTKHALPSIMYYFSQSAMSGKTVEAYIEYVLTAELGDTKASLPLYIRQRSVQSPITNYRMRSRSFPQVTKTPRLLSEHADRPLTFRQKSGMVFRPSKTPKYAYTIEVEFPTVIQIEHPDPIPLKICLVPNLDPEKTTICPDKSISSLPPVQVLSMEIKLKGDVHIRCPGILWDSGTVKNHTFDFPFRRYFKPVVIPVVQPAHSKHIISVPEDQTVQQSSFLAPEPIANGLTASPSIDPVLQSSPLNLGSYLSILLGSSASSTLKQPAISFKRQVYPTFSTYNISLTYTLKWMISLSCADEGYNINGETPVTILAPSEEQEESKERQLGTAGMKKNYNDLEEGFGAAMQFIGQILQAVTG